MLIAWEKNEIVDSYNIYRLISTNYQLIANVPYSSSSSYYDQTVNPGVSAYRYKVSANHAVCNNEGPSGDYHGSIHISSSPATTGGVNLTVTDPYIDGSGQYVPSVYYILIDSLNNGHLTIVDSMSAVFNSYLVQNPVNGSTYAMAVNIPWSCNGAKAQHTLAMSNKTTPMVGIDEHQTAAAKVQVYPNPSSGLFRFSSTEKIAQIQVYDYSGKLILQSQNMEIDLSGQPNGLYLAKIIGIQDSGFVKLVLMR
jgi:hypothetical protein